MKIKIKPQKIAAFIILFLLLNLPSYEYMGRVIPVVSDVSRVVAVFALGFWLFKRRAMHVTPLICFICLLQFTLIFSTLIHNADIRTCILRACSIIALALLFEVWSHDMKSLIFAMMPLMELLCYGNYLTILLFPKGMFSSFIRTGLWYTEKNWLLGNRNIFVEYLVPAYLIAFLYRQYGGKRWREYGIYIIGFISVAFPPVRSGTSTVGLFLLFVLLFMVRCGFRFRVYTLVCVNIAAFLGLVVFRLQNAFDWLIVGILGKDLTLTGRTDIWDSVFRLMRERPLLGYGDQTAADSAALLGVYGGSTAHNLILDYLYSGGLIQLALYLVMMIVLYRGLRKVQGSVTTQAISVTMFVFQIMGLAESYQNNPFFYTLYYFAFFASRIAEAAPPAAQAGGRMHRLFRKKKLRGMEGESIELGSAAAPETE